MCAFVQTEELGDVIETLPKDVFLAPGNDGTLAKSKLEQPFTAAGIVEYVDRLEIDAFLRKKLFQLGAATSPRLNEKGESFSRGVHARSRKVGNGRNG